MKYFKECMVDEKEEYMTARDIGLRYGIALGGRLGPGPKVAALLKKYIEENDIDYSETYYNDGGRLSLVYPKCIYERMVMDMDIYSEKKFEYEILVSYKRDNISKSRCHTIAKIIAENQLAVRDIFENKNPETIIDDIESDYVKDSIKLVSILGKREIS